MNFVTKDFLDQSLKILYNDEIVVNFSLLRVLDTVLSSISHNVKPLDVCAKGNSLFFIFHF